MKKLLVVLSIVVVSLMALGPVAVAGEYSPGNNGTAAKGKGASLCLFSGAEQPDESGPGVGDGEEAYTEEGVYVGDDADWAATPARGKAQSYGQIVAAGGKAFAPSPGVACNPTRGFEE